MASITYRYTASGEVEFVASRNAAQRYPWHLHAAHWVSGVVLSGGLVLETRAEARYLRTGGYFRIPRLCAHRLFLEPGTTLLAACLPTNSSILPYDARLAGLVRKACAPLALGARAEHLARHLLHAQPPEESTAEPPIQTVCRLLLDDPAKGLIVEHNMWREMIWQQENSVLCVAADSYYEAEDYIRDYDEFLKTVQAKG